MIRQYMICLALWVGLATIALAQKESQATPTATDGTAKAENATPAEVPPLPDLTIPANADAATLEKLITTAKQIKPANPDQFKAMQTAIRDASKQLMVVLKDKDLPRYQQAQLDSIAGSVSLLTFFGEEAREKTIEQLKEHLKQRDSLTIGDIQMAMLAAANLELQPNKQPSKEIYTLVDELLAKDKREEMQNMRIILQSAIHRLELLGSKLEIDAKSIANKPIKTEQYAGKFVIVDFFASWCQPCLSEVPRLKKHYEKYKSKGLEVFAVSLDEDEKALSKYLSTAELPWPVIHDNCEDLAERFQMKFGISALPTVLLLNKEGTVISLEARGAELDRLMDMIFEAPTPADPPAKPEAKPADKSETKADSKSDAKLDAKSKK